MIFSLRSRSIGFFVLVLFNPSLAFGYLDPGSGSYFFQLLIAFLVGALYSVKLFWNKILSFFKKMFNIKQP